VRLFFVSAADKFLHWTAPLVFARRFLCAADFGPDHLAQELGLDQNGTWPAMPAEHV